jgi:four helix bundle protein
MAERPHRRLIAWQKAIDLTQNVYAVTSKFPIEERFGLTSQMKRAAVSVASNIAEGAARFSTGEKLHFFRMARGSLSELDTQIEITERLAYLSSNDRSFLQEHLDEVGRLLQGLIASRLHEHLP